MKKILLRQLDTEEVALILGLESVHGSPDQRMTGLVRRGWLGINQRGLCLTAVTRELLQVIREDPENFAKETETENVPSEAALFELKKREKT